jgi:hypothetical protein
MDSIFRVSTLLALAVAANTVYTSRAAATLGLGLLLTSYPCPHADPWTACLNSLITGQQRRRPGMRIGHPRLLTIYDPLQCILGRRGSMRR